MEHLDLDRNRFYTEEDYWKVMEFAVEHSWIGYIIADRQGKYIYTNQIYESITGIPPSVMVGFSAESTQKDEILSQNSVISQILASKKEVVTEQQLRDRKIVVRGMPYFDERGEVKYVLTQLFNIEKLNRTHLEVTRSSKKGLEHFDKVETKANQVSEGSTDYVVYKSDVMRRVMDQARLIAVTDATVLLLGESGTGKELVAKFIHQASRRREEPFIRINCSAIPENLLESELFGYEAGSFTGGISGGKKGLLEYANHGTVLLDEIGDMPYHMQAKILRVLQEKEIMRIGGNKPIRLDIRFIASTNVNIPSLIREKQFRSDLYYRLNMAPIKLPPLRERREDIPLLIAYFLGKFNQAYHTNKTMDNALEETLTALPLLGNIRELRNMLERLIIMTPTSLLTASDLLEVPLDDREEAETEAGICPECWEGKSLEAILDEYEKQVLTYYKNKCGKNAALSARLKVHPSTITRKLQQYGIK